jgi:hypothetical protein
VLALAAAAVYMHTHMVAATVQCIHSWLAAGGCAGGWRVAGGGELSSASGFSFSF